MLYYKRVKKKHRCQPETSTHINRVWDNTVDIYQCRDCREHWNKCKECDFRQILGRGSGRYGTFECKKCSYVHLDYATIRTYGKFDHILMERVLR